MIPRFVPVAGYTMTCIIVTTLTYMYHLYEGCIRFKLRCLRACSARAQSNLTSRVGGMSPVVKQMTSNTVVAILDVCCMASQFKSSLATVAGSVALFTHCKAVQL